jgi:hypothetical protein
METASFLCPISFSNTESHFTTCEVQYLKYACRFKNYLRSSYASNRILVTKISITTHLDYVEWCCYSHFVDIPIFINVFTPPPKIDVVIKAYLCRRRTWKPVRNAIGNHLLETICSLRCVPVVFMPVTEPTALLPITHVYSFLTATYLRVCDKTCFSWYTVRILRYQLVLLRLNMDE